METEEIILPSIKTITEETKSGSFLIEPLYPGYGMTIGNALRRVLLSSLPGAAISSVKIDGVSHEFSTLPHVKEDILNIVFNLKLVRVQIKQGDRHTLTLQSKGEGVVTAADIKGNADVVILNPEQPLFTITTPKGVVNMEIEVERGRGYVSAEERREKRPIGEIAIDALYTPVTRVSYSVENTRVGQATNFDKIMLDVETDGTTSPRQAITDAANILVEQFSLLAGNREPSKMAEKKGSRVSGRDEDMSVEEVDFSTRTINALLKNNIKSMKQLSSLSTDEIGSLRGMGAKAQEEIAEKIVELGLK
ncbi:MAG: DNA-directed RNA polymerase subunit alpha [Patescibacteria group bacterium]